MSSKKFILIQIDDFDDFIRTHVEFNRVQKEGHFKMSVGAVIKEVIQRQMTLYLGI